MKKTILALVIASASFTAIASNVPTTPVQTATTASPSATMTFKENVPEVCGIRTTADSYYEGSIKFNDEDANDETFVDLELATNGSKSKANVTVTKIENDVKEIGGVIDAKAGLWIGANKHDADFSNVIAHNTATEFPMNTKLKAIAVTEKDSTQIAVGNYTVQTVLTIDCKA